MKPPSVRCFKRTDQDGYMVSITWEGKRIKRSYPSKAKSEAAAQEFRYHLQMGDFADVYPDVSERLGITTAPDRLPWSKAVESWAAHCSDINNRPAGVRDINHCRLAGRRLGDPCMGAVTAGQMSDYITSNYTNEKSRRTIRSALVMFLNWSNRRGLLSEAIDGKDMSWVARKVDKKPICFLTVDGARALIDNCIAYNQRLQLDESRTMKYRLALGCAMFLGVRPGAWVQGAERYGELQSLRWSDWDSSMLTLTIRAEIAKNRNERVIGNLPDNILQAFAAAEGVYRRDEYICPGNYANWRRKLAKWAEGAGVKLGHDILRHTFGTYGFWRSLEWALDTGGWDNPATMFTNYRSKKADAGMAGDFFSIPLSLGPG